MLDRDLAVLLDDDERRRADPGAVRSADELVDSLPAYDDGELPDPFAQIPRGMS